MSEIKFGERIRAVRKKAGCNQKEFGELLDIPQSTLSAYETDRMQPTVAALISIATTFNVSLDWLCGIEGSKENAFRLGLSDKSLRMLTRLKRNDDSRLHIISLLLEQADDDIEKDELGEKCMCSVLTAICCYLERYRTVDDFILDLASRSDESAISSIRSALYRLIISEVT